MKKVIAIIDIGKTNKKLFLFDENYHVVSQNSIQFDEIVDEDGFPCDDIESIEKWILSEIKKIQDKGDFKIKALNFSTHGASLIYLNEKGQRIAPLYNYLKPLDLSDFEDFYKSNGGVEEFSRKTASPAYGMLNTGIQMLRLRKYKPEIWKNVKTILHYPQYLSFLFTKKITADFTSVGAHTATWDFDNMKYHKWLKDEDITLPEPCKGNEAIITDINGEQIAVGSGLHDSSSSIIPILENDKGKDFVLLSTGTWIITMNPFSAETLTQHQLKNNCLCFMTPEKQQVKSSMQFLGRIHEVYLKALSDHFKVDVNTHLDLVLNNTLCKELLDTSTRVFLSEGIDTDFEAHPELLQKFTSYETAYYQLIYEISKKVISGINLISDKNVNISNVYISGGFNRNEVFIEFLKLLKPNITIKISDCKNESALGAALLMKDYLK
ncbi:sugar (pentulose or hexulose) kinase [Mariniflexile fucanivorans]|uniref:Sugar (Pentulose or hexulose) kinase n=1 Tax=Mariniflexile fucanivorans TaxID=264023 RepID=A0A4R1RIV6_9FLAO|nr:FGGY family carbohydrate kinase [Mariniflexile fucanivorans]TCL66041.1 sugar (pentulose or hexulose) kinase [Mariniflexile fucanivorans]